MTDRTTVPLTGRGLHGQGGGLLKWLARGRLLTQAVVTRVLTLYTTH